MKSYHQKDGITIYCGDNVKTMREAIPDGSIDLTVTSPPYDNLRDYNGYTWDFEGVAAELWRVTKPGGVVVWVVGDATIDGSETGTSFRQALHFMGLGFRLHQTLFYNKGAGKPPDNTRYIDCIEYMFVFSKGKPKIINLIEDRKNKYPGPTGKYSNREKNGTLTQKKSLNVNAIGKRLCVWNVSSGFMKSTNDKNAYIHPAIFPEALARDHIISWSNPGDIVFDPFLGSGTTAKMALKLDRQCIGIELSQDYCDIAIERLNKARADLGQSHTVNVNGIEAKQGAMFE